MIFLNAFLLGSAIPLMFDAMNRLIGSEVRATALSVANMTGSLSFVIISPLFGKMVDTLSLSKAFVIMGLFFVVCGGLIAVVIDRTLKQSPEKS
jgi:MFS family permease